MGLFLEVFLKFQNTFKNTNEEMLLILLILRFGRETNTSSSIEKLIAFRKKGETHMLFSKERGNAHVRGNVLMIKARLKDYSNKPVKRKSL